MSYNTSDYDTDLTADTPGQDNQANLSDRVLDREEDEDIEKLAPDKAGAHVIRLTEAGAEDGKRSDNQKPAEQLLDGDESGSLPDPETLSLRSGEK